MLMLLVSKQSPVSGQQHQEAGGWREAEEEEEEQEEGISILCSPQTDSPR